MSDAGGSQRPKWKAAQRAICIVTISFSFKYFAVSAAAAAAVAGAALRCG